MLLSKRTMTFSKTGFIRKVCAPAASLSCKCCVSCTFSGIKPRFSVIRKSLGSPTRYQQTDRSHTASRPIKPVDPSNFTCSKHRYNVLTPQLAEQSEQTHDDFKNVLMSRISTQVSKMHGLISSSSNAIPAGSTG